MKSELSSRSSELAVDPLSDVLSLLRPTGTMSGAIDKAGDWAVRFGPHAGIKFQAVISGGYWLRVEGVDEPLRIEAGDCYLLPRGRPFSIASDLSLAPVDAHAFLQTPLNGGVRRINGGGECYSLGCYFEFSGRHAEVLLAMLPPIVHIRAEADKAAMRWFVERLMLELREPQPGGTLVMQQLSTLLLVQALRLQLDDGLRRGGVGWLFALADRQMRAAIGAMHDDPARRWTLQSLAERACMSRSSFALKFRQTVGTPPMDYLARWRMLLAADRLTRSGDSIATLSQALGYDSESAFSTAFKRVMGSSPRRYGRRAGATDAPVTG
jgi:AraC-like DNA-binding protein